jgi:hypothetical protein
MVEWKRPRNKGEVVLIIFSLSPFKHAIAVCPKQLFLCTLQQESMNFKKVLGAKKGIAG